jgi:hypothetical protein
MKEDLDIIASFLNEGDLNLHSEALQGIVSETGINSNQFLRQCILLACVVYGTNNEPLEADFHKSLIAALANIYARRDRRLPWAEFVMRHTRIKR